ncbi:MAG: Flp pilus assembly protein CpaB [Terracidiphilus sp.]|jgi:pilus assembly protein CpaB
MNRRVLTILVVAFLIAAACTFLVIRLIHNQTTAARPPATTLVVAAKSNIKLGAILTADNLTTVEIAGSVPKGAILTKDKNSAVGRGVLSDLYEGEPIIENRLAAAGSGGGLAATIPQGMRACAVKVDEVVNVSGFVTPGMRVDVLISGTPPGQQSPTQGTVSRTLLQNIQVLSAGTDYQKDAEGKAKTVQVVNLLVTPEQAEILSLASNQVKIQLVLRNPLDTKVAAVPGTATGNLFSGQIGASSKSQHTKRVAPRYITVVVLNGSKQTEEKFASPGGHQ